MVPYGMTAVNWVTDLRYQKRPPARSVSKWLRKVPDTHSRCRFESCRSDRRGPGSVCAAPQFGQLGKHVKLVLTVQPGN